MKDLYHYTCSDAKPGIDASGVVWPMAFLRAGSVIVETGLWAWFTDLAEPDRAALGLTSHSLSCDRTEHRYRARFPQDLGWWPLVGDDRLSRLLEADAGDPLHWWVSRGGVLVEYAPVLEDGQ